MDLIRKLKISGVASKKLAICESPKTKKFTLTSSKGLFNYKKLNVVADCLPDTHDYYIIYINFPLDTARKKLTVTSLNVDAGNQKEPFIFTYFDDFLKENNVKLVNKHYLASDKNV